MERQNIKWNLNLSSPFGGQGAFWILFFVLSAILFIRLGATPIYILDEAKNAQCAREMLQRGDFIVPTFNGELRVDKPPLHYFFMMAAYKMFGISEFSARFFSVVMGLLTILVTYNYTKRLFNVLAAFCACIVLATSTQFLFEFRLSVPDPYLIFFITLGLFSAFTWLKENNISQLYISAAAFALATLAKGPVALALPGLCLLIWVITQKKWKELFTWHLIPALVLLLAITLPWYIAVDRATNGAWTKGFFIEHNFNRFSDTQEGHGGFFLLTLLFVLIGLLPFMSFIGETLKNRKIVFQNDLVRFSGVVVIVFIIFFSISSTKLPNYAMPCYPFAAVILGSFITALLSKSIASKKYPLYILTVVLLVLPVVGYFAIRQEVETSSFSWIAWLIIIIPLCFIFFLLVNNNASWEKRIYVTVVLYSLLNIILLYYIYPTLYKQNPVAKTIGLIKKSRLILSYKIYNPGYNFYLDESIKKYESVDSLNVQLQQNPDAIIISRKEFLDSLQLLNLDVIAEHHDIFELPTTIVLKRHAKP
ncbi:MAG TPA: glycosyltransferase family 39 protein [Chitinophagaceae bacterium]|nr:glycosyltransferase family 39 protein [Chitinophagaceae bacterium]